MSFSDRVKPANDLEKVATIVSEAFGTLPFHLLVSREKQQLPDYVETVDQDLDRAKERLVEHLQSGAKAYEADDFNAVAIWYPPGVDAAEHGESLPPTIERFFEVNREVKKKYLHKNEFWYLNTLARNLGQPASKGAISELIRPVLEDSKERNIPVLINAISPHAKDVYEHFGFEVVEQHLFGVDKSAKFKQLAKYEHGVTMYVMLYNHHD